MAKAISASFLALSITQTVRQLGAQPAQHADYTTAGRPAHTARRPYDSWVPNPHSTQTIRQLGAYHTERPAPASAASDSLQPSGQKVAQSQHSGLSMVVCALWSMVACVPWSGGLCTLVGCLSVKSAHLSGVHIDEACAQGRHVARG